MSETHIRTTVNGQDVERHVQNRATLAELLRDRLGLRGTKVSCEAQVCGACTVLVNDQPVSSCTYLAVDVDDRAVTTIEGMASRDGLHPIQQAFIDHTAMQCGYCTPGFVMAAKALIAENPDPTREEVQHALEGNICRCTGYIPIIDAVLDAAARMRAGGDALAPDSPGESGSLASVAGTALDGPGGSGTPVAVAASVPGASGANGIPAAVAGTAVTRVDALAKVTGAAGYAIDAQMPDMLESAVVRSDRAHAKVLAVRVDAALKSPGCVAVVTGNDLAGLYPRFGHIVPDHQILALEKVRYYGEPVALVIAETRYAAADAAALVEVEYEDLPPILNARDALADGAALVHEQNYSGDSISTTKVDEDGREPNVAHISRRSWGDVETAMEAAHLVVETRTHHPMLYAYAMEPYNAVARFSDGNLDVITTAQHPFMVSRDLARVFGMPQSRIRVSVPYIGGGYGSKSYTKVEPLAAVGAWYTGRAVRVALSVEESIYTTRADSADVVVRSGFDAEGHIVAREFDVILDTGAYADNSPQVLQKAVNRCFGPYRIPNVRVLGRAVYTNTSPASSYRALGAFQTNLAGETNMDQAAQRLGIEPEELRRRNLVRRGEELIPGLRPMDADLGADLDELSALLHSEPRAGYLQGVGVGCGANEGGAYPTSTAQVRIVADGSAVVLSGSTEMGQGSRTVLAQIAATELGLPMERLRVMQSDTAITPFERTTGGSRTTTLTGLAVQRACADVLAKLAEIGAENLKCAIADVRVEGGAIVHSDGRSQTYAEALRQWFGPGAGELVGVGVVRRAGELTQLPVFWEIGMVGVAVDIDPETGVVEVDQLVTVADVGFAINPAGVEGQDLGAAMQGLGGALSEELIYDGQQIINSNMVEYRVPRTIDLPRRYAAYIAQRRDGPGPYGSKGVGEGARIPAGGAIAGAVARAVGVWPDRLPLTPERVWRLIQKAKDLPPTE